jgi:hypothetical protein
MPDRSACKACRHKQHSQHHSNHVWYKLYVATLKLLRSIHVPVSVILVQRKILFSPWQQGQSVGGKGGRSQYITAAAG